MLENKKTIGRFAPSPSGDLHLGNLRTALIAWLHARLQEGKFYLRVEDLDSPRVVKGSADRILMDLEWLGLDWDSEVVYQSQRTEIYQSALSKLETLNLLYPCFCSRKDIHLAASAPHGKQGVYPGTCAMLERKSIELHQQKKNPALRFRVADQIISFVDCCVGEIEQNLKRDCGDFVVKRSDDLFAYHLAVVVDDIEQGVTQIVRGADLIDSTAKQIHLIQILYPDALVPVYSHVPVMLDSNGLRMAKRDGAMSISEWRSDGGNRQELVGLLAKSIDLIDEFQPISATQLLKALSFTDLQRALTKQVTAKDE